MWRRSISAAAVFVGAMLAGFVVWIIGLKGASNRAEALCLDDLSHRPGYGSYRMSSGLWPPSFECRLAGNAVEPIVVQHRLHAVAMLGWVVLIPILFTIGTIALTVLATRRLR